MGECKRRKTAERLFQASRCRAKKSWREGGGVPKRQHNSGPGQGWAEEPGGSRSDFPGVGGGPGVIPFKSSC